MGWGRMLLLGNVGQQMDIDELTDYLNKAVAEMNQNQTLDRQQSAEIARLKAENQELKLYVLGLIRLLSAKKVISEAEVNQLVITIDDPSSPS
jgi:hypothetical protein